MPPSVEDWLPQRHLARFVVEVVDGLDLRAMSGAYRGSGSASYYPGVLLSLLVYGYATGVFSSRKLERATYDSVAFRFIAANDHPDHDTIATFRRRFLKEIEALFVEVLKLAREMGVLRMGTVALDGTKIHANASRHSALSYERAGEACPWAVMSVFKGCGRRNPPRLVIPVASSDAGMRGGGRALSDG
jgi:transposase